MIRLRYLFGPALLSAWSAVAQQPPLHLTLAEAGRLAIQNNPRFSAAKFTAAAAYEVPKQYRASLEPGLAASFTGVGADNGSRLAAGGLNNPVVYDRVASGLTVSQLVTDFGRTANLVGSAKLRAAAQDRVTEATRADILLATGRAYLAVLRAAGVLKVTTQTVAARQLVADQVTALADSKLKSTLDVSFANVNLADARLMEIQAQNDLQAAEATLATAIGLPGESGFVLDEEPLPPQLSERIDPLLRQAIEDRPDLGDLRLEESAARRFARAEHGLYYPSVGVIGTAGFAPAGTAAIPGRYGAIGLSVNIPVFNGGLFKARQTEAELRARAAGEEVHDLENRVVRDVRVAYLNATSAYDRIAVTEQLLRQAQLGLDLAQSRYDLGLASIVELSQAQLNLTSAQIANTTAKYDYQSRRIELDYQLGALR